MAGVECIRLELVCRGCLREEDRMVPIFDAGNEPRIDTMLADTFALRMSENDGLPSRLCVSCSQQLSTAFIFKKMCQSSDNKIKAYMKELNPKSLSSQFQARGAAGAASEESSIGSSVKVDLIDFNSLLSSEAASIKVEKDNNDIQLILNDADDKKDFSVTDSSTSISFSKSRSVEKCTRSKPYKIVNDVFNCCECSKKFSSLNGVLNHLKCKHSMENIIACLDCDNLFTEQNRYKEHMKSVHNKVLEESNPSKFEYQICNKVLTEKNRITKHKLTHGYTKLFRCSQCNISFNERKDYEKHNSTCPKKESTRSEPNPTLKTDAGILGKTAPDRRNESQMKNLHIRENSTNVRNSVDTKPSIIKIKEEPLEQLLEEADRVQILENETRSNDGTDNDDLYSISEYDEKMDTEDTSEEEAAPRRRVGRPRKAAKVLESKINKTDSADANYECSICTKRVATSLGLKIHMARHFSNNNITYTCEECNESFKRLHELKQHEICHPSDPNSKKYTCTVCNKSFQKQYQKAEHMWEHSENKVFQCEDCHRSFVKLDLLARHKLAAHSGKKKNPKTAFCSICSRGFTTEKYLETHMRMHTGDKTFTCPTCNKSFNTKWHLKEHSKWHSAEKPFLCSECGQRFIRNDYLVTHMRRHNGEKPYKCKFCNKGFPRATDLTVHERYHTGEKTHLCTICGKGFQRQYNLTVHLRVHTGEKPYVCTYCGKRFAQGNDLKSHVRRHTGERFNCDLCGEGFIQGYHLTQHKKTTHGIQCSSHIRRVEKHPRLHPDRSKRTTSSSDRQTPMELENGDGNQTQTSNVNEEPSTSVETQNVSPDERQNDKSSTDSAPNIPVQHISIEQPQLSVLQAIPTEIDLTQRVQTLPGLMPLMPLAIFPAMNARIQ